MAATRPTSTRNLDGYGNPPIEWDRIRDRLDQGLTQAPDTGGPNRHSYWLTTIRPDGTPHVVPLAAMWDDGVFFFTTSPNTRRARNLAQNPRCVLAVSTQQYDIVVEGRAERVLDVERVRHALAFYNAAGWPAEVIGDTPEITAPFNAPSAGPPPYHVYEITPEKAFALWAEEPGGATIWTF